MPDDTPQKKSTFTLSSSPENASFAGVPAAVQTMSDWTPEQWESPDHFSEFPLLNICPEAPEFFAQARHFSNKDLKAIAAIMGEDFDPNDTARLYRAILCRIQSEPWVFPIMETFVMQNRGGQKGPRAHKPAKKRGVISKLPLSKLRLDAHPELHGRTHELLLDDVPADIAVAAFCEYAVMNYDRKLSDPDEFEEVRDEAKDILSCKGPTDFVETRLPEYDEGKGWIDFGNKLGALLDMEPRASSLLILRHLHMGVKGLAEDLHIGSMLETARVNLIQDLSSRARRMQETLSDEITSTAEERLRAIGAFEDNEDPKNIASPMAGILLSDRFYELVLGRRNKIADTAESLDTIGADIAAATAEKEYVRVRELAIRTGEIENKINRMNKAYQKVIDIFRSLGDDTPDRFISLIENYDPADDADIFDEDYNLSDYQQISDEIRDQSIRQSRADIQHKNDETDLDEDEPPYVSTESGDEKVNVADDPDDTFGDAEGPASALVVDDENNPGEIRTPEPQSVEYDHEDSIDASGAPGLEEDMGINEEVPDETPPSRLAPIDLETFASLFDRNFVAIAANVAEAFEAEGVTLPLPASALRVAAASRAPYRGFDPGLQKFNELVGVATASPLSDLASVLILGSILRPAILSKDTALRNQVSDLCKGTLGQHLVEINDTVSRLDFAFPPKPDKLAELSGSPGTPERQRLADRLSKICSALGQKKSRWPFATELMHHVVSPSGTLGAAAAAISGKKPDALKLAQTAINNLRSSSAIESLSEKYAAEKGYNDLALYRKGAEYLAHQFDEPIALIEGWIQTTQPDGTGNQQSEERIKRTAATLRSQLEKATHGLQGEVERTEDPLVASVAMWIMGQLEKVREALLGRDTGDFSTFDEALNAEMDLLPPVDRDALLKANQRAEIYTRVLSEGQIFDREEAMTRACKEGAFDTAFRMVDQFDVSSHEEVRKAIAGFVAEWRSDVELRNRRLMALDKVDFKNQEEISRQLAWCKLTLEKLGTLDDGTKVYDIAGLGERLARLDKMIADIKDNIRDGQIARINEYRKPRNEEDVENLLAKLDELTIEAIEDRIAQLRDGRSAAVFETDLKGLIGAFTPDFLSFASSEDWPRNDSAFKTSIADPGSPLFTEDDRRRAAMGFIKIFRNTMMRMRVKEPTQGQLRELFEEVGLEQVNVSNVTEFGRKGSWAGNLSARIVSDGWFLPPVFGSNSTNGYRFILASPETLPETMIKAIGDSDRPTIIFLSGVADASRRHEIAERLRAKSLPALLIDEALIAFAATRRDTRARTIFECGLPYGRIEPYTTDAGQLPPEMFFGREDEVRKIIAKTADGCLVYGGRQLGKSALLAHIAQTQHDPEKKRFIVNREVKPLGNSEKTIEIWRHISSMLPDEIVNPDHTSPEDVAKDIQAWVGRTPNGRIICMFDEADNFMTQDTRDDYPQLSKLKELMEKTQRAFKVVFAGLHNVQRMHKQPNSPLWHLGEPICIGPLNRNIDDKRAAFDLVVAPMRAAGFGFETTQAVEEILTWVNYYPSLVQEYMKGLLSTMHGAGSGKTYKLPTNGPLWTIPSDTLFDRRGFNHIENRIRDKFHLTLNLDPRYALVAYTLARLVDDGDERSALITGLSPRKLMEEAEIYWPKTSEAPTLPAFEALLEELFDLGVLGRNPIPGSENRFNYLFRTREVAAMLGTGVDIYHELDEIENKDPTIAYDRATHRRRYSAAPKQPQQIGHMHLLATSRSSS